MTAPALSSTLVCHWCRVTFQPRKYRTPRYCSQRCARLHQQAIARRKAATVFWGRIDMSGPTCWPWRGNINRRGYGYMRFKGRRWTAHRLAYFLFHRSIPKSKHICHHCDTPLCCRPDHLFAGTAADNLADMRSKGRHAHGERHYLARLTEADVVAIRRSPRTNQTLAAIYGVSDSLISLVRLRHIWRHVA